MTMLNRGSDVLERLLQQSQMLKAPYGIRAPLSQSFQKSHRIIGEKK